MLLARDQRGMAHFSRVVNVTTRRSTRFANEQAKIVADDQTQLTFLGPSPDQFRSVPP